MNDSAIRAVRVDTNTFEFMQIVRLHLAGRFRPLFVFTPCVSNHSNLLLTIHKEVAGI